MRHDPSLFKAVLFKAAFIQNTLFRVVRFQSVQLATPFAVRSMARMYVVSASKGKYCRYRVYPR